MRNYKCPNCGASWSLPLGMTCSDHHPIPIIEHLDVKVICRRDLAVFTYEGRPVPRRWMPAWYWRLVTDRISSAESFDRYPFTNDCPWLRGTGTCNMGCWEEPACEPGAPLKPYAWRRASSEADR